MHTALCIVARSDLEVVQVLQLLRGEFLLILRPCVLVGFSELRKHVFDGRRYRCSRCAELAQRGNKKLRQPTGDFVRPSRDQSRCSQHCRVGIQQLLLESVLVSLS